MKRIFNVLAITMSGLVILVIFVLLTDGILPWIVGVPKQESLKTISGTLESVTKCADQKNPRIYFVVDSSGKKKRFSLTCSRTDPFPARLRGEIGLATIVLYQRPVSLLAFSESLEPDEIWDLKTPKTQHIEYAERARHAEETSGLLALAFASIAIVLVLVLRKLYKIRFPAP